MPKTLIELKSMNLERGHGALAKEIAEHIGKDSDFDEKIIQLSPRRFDEVMTAYSTIACEEGKLESTNTYIDPDDSIERKILDENKRFKTISDKFLADQLSGELFIKVLEYGLFRTPAEINEYEKAKKAKKFLEQYLMKTNSTFIKTLSIIQINEPGSLTIDEFLNNKKEYICQRYSSYDHSTDRLDRIFSYIKNQVKTMHETYIKSSVGQTHKDVLPLSLEEKKSILNEAMDVVVSKQNEIAEYIYSKRISAIDNFRKKALYSNTLRKRHEAFYKKS